MKRIMYSNRTRKRGASYETGAGKRGAGREKAGRKSTEAQSGTVALHGRLFRWTAGRQGMAGAGTGVKEAGA